MGKPKQRPFQFSLRMLLLVVAGCALLFGLLRYLYDRDIRQMYDAYALIQVSDMITRYMIANDDAWPRDWDDLREPYEATKGSYGFHAFESLRDRVVVDFRVDAREILRAESDSDGSSFRFIYSRYGKTNWGWRESEPNQRIFEYLNRNSSDVARGMEPPPSPAAADQADR